MYKYIPETNVVYLENRLQINMNKFICNFKKFKTIDIDQKNKIEKIVKVFKEKNLGTDTGLNYVKTLQYLCTSNAKTKLLSTRVQKTNNVVLCDEYFAFIILCCDPNCNLYKSYLKCNENMTSSQKESFCRKESGLFDKKLIIAEKDYFFKFENKLLFEVKKDSSNYFMQIKDELGSFDSISNQRFEEIQNQAYLWADVPNNNSKFQTALYQIIFQSDLLNLNTLEERIVFFITAVDPNLEILTIFEEESKFENVKCRIKEKYNSYSKELITYEKLYKKRFFPDKVISPWTKQKL